MKLTKQNRTPLRTSPFVRMVERPLAQKLGQTFVALALSTATFHSALAQVNLASGPVFLSESADPNLMFIYDDSGSMSREYMPDSLSRDLRLFVDEDNGPFTFTFEGDTFKVNNGRVWYYSNRVNTVYYDPEITYRPPFKTNGTERRSNNDFTNAWFDGYAENGAVDLRTEYRTSRFIETTRLTYENGAFYYRFNSTNSCDADPKQNSCYTLVFLKDESTEQQLNFANWYSYYRTRAFSSRAGISEAFVDLPENIRLGYGALGSASQTVDGETTDTIISGVRPYTSVRRQEFLAWLQGKATNLGSTPLRTALEDAGEYYSRTDNKGPWGETPGTDDNTAHVECRPSYTILMTDGVRNGGSPSVGNADKTPGPSHTNPDPLKSNFSYEAVSPFTDEYPNTLADVAMKYWKTDLRPNLANKVPTAGLDDAFWQHMTTFTIGLGVEGAVSKAEAFAAIRSGAPVSWPDPDDGDNDSSDRIDDLLHSAVNSRGGFASAQNPEEFSSEIKGFLDTVIARTETSASAAAVSSAVLRTESAGFFAGFRSTDWSGTLTAFNFDDGLQLWDAEEVLRNTLPVNRNILTHDGSTGVELNNINSLSDSQIAALNANPEVDNTADDLGSERISWIRGEANAHSSFRVREFTTESGDVLRRLLGDIINANPVFASNSNFGFVRLPGDEGTKYSAFRSTSDYQERTKALYVAANDGMLHSFDSETGEELFAFMPGELLNAAGGSSHSQISSLISANYTHRYFVDGTPKVLDAYIETEVGGTTQTAWRTILVGGMGAGGSSVFAIDITNPDSVGPDDILWEFSHADLGKGVTDPEIARLPNGKWAAIFGNGYNGDDDAASLFIVDLAKGTLIKQLETGAGTIASPNGLAAPALTSFPDRGAITNYIYAGDLFGNLWRFDLTGTNTNQWSSTKLFTATDPNGAPQPFTVAPRLTINPNNLDELILNIGTGSFIRTGDDVDDQVQTVYSIQDDLTQSGLTRTNLLPQTITGQQDVTVARADGSGNNEYKIRETSNNLMPDGKNGWYIDLSYQGSQTGERVVSRASFPFGIFPDRVRFSTLIPDSNPCGSGRKGFIMDLKLATGATPDDPVFDLNSDGIFNTQDLSDGSATGFIPSGISAGAGAEIRTITADGSEAFITDPMKIDKDDPCKTAICGKALDNSIGRQTWEQLR